MGNGEVTTKPSYCKEKERRGIVIMSHNPKRRKEALGALGKIVSILRTNRLIMSP
jgi:hypothetical protein